MVFRSAVSVFSDGESIFCIDFSKRNVFLATAFLLSLILTIFHSIICRHVQEKEAFVVILGCFIGISCAVSGDTYAGKETLVGVVILILAAALAVSTETYRQSRGWISLVYFVGLTMMFAFLIFLVIFAMLVACYSPIRL